MRRGRMYGARTGGSIGHMARLFDLITVPVPGAVVPRRFVTLLDLQGSVPGFTRPIIRWKPGLRQQMMHAACLQDPSHLPGGEGSAGIRLQNRRRARLMEECAQGRECLPRRRCLSAVVPLVQDGRTQ